MVRNHGLDLRGRGGDVFRMLRFSAPLSGRVCPAVPASPTGSDSRPKSDDRRNSLGEDGSTRWDAEAFSGSNSASPCSSGVARQKRPPRPLLFHLFLFEDEGSRLLACAGGNAVSMAACPLLTACSSEAASCSAAAELRSQARYAPAGRSRCRDSVSPGSATLTPSQTIGCSTSVDGRTVTCDGAHLGSSAAVFPVALPGWLLAILLQCLAGQRNRRRGLLLASALATAATSSLTGSADGGLRLGFDRDGAELLRLALAPRSASGSRPDAWPSSARERRVTHGDGRDGRASGGYPAGTLPPLPPSSAGSPSASAAALPAGSAALRRRRPLGAILIALCAAAPTASTLGPLLASLALRRRSANSSESSCSSRKSVTYRNASRSSPRSTNADCMPGSTRVTLPL